MLFLIAPQRSLMGEYPDKLDIAQVICGPFPLCPDCRPNPSAYLDSMVPVDYPSR